MSASRFETVGTVMAQSAMVAGIKRSLAERYQATALLLPDTEQERCLRLAADTAAEAWNFAIANPNESVYRLHKRFKDGLGGSWDELAICRQAAHCAIRDVHSRLAYGSLPDPKDPKTLIQFRAGGRLAYFSEQGLHLGLKAPLKLAEHDIPLREIGSPYVVSVRATWTFDGWAGEFLLRHDPEGQLKLAAFRRGNR